MYPVFLNLTGRRVVVVGGGPVAASKMHGLLREGAHITVVAPDVRPEIEAAGVDVRRRRFEDADLDDAWWVVAAAPPDVNRQVQEAAERRRIYVNAVDDPRHATAYLDSEYTHDPAERERIFRKLLAERDQILALGPKYRQLVRDEPALIDLFDRAAAKHDEAVGRGEAEPFTSMGLTS